MEYTSRELPEPIEVLPEVKRLHSGQAQGGETTVYRLRYMTAKQIERHGLQKYLENDTPR